MTSWMGAGWHDQCCQRAAAGPVAGYSCFVTNIMHNCHQGYNFVLNSTTITTAPLMRLLTPSVTFTAHAAQLACSGERGSCFVASRVWHS